MTTIFAQSALLPDGWADHVLIEIDKDGWIVGVDAGKPLPEENSDAEVIKAPVISGMVNAHSHAWQRGMAGLAERGRGEKRSFWGWRETLYRFLSDITPEDIRAIAAHTYVLMLKAGYTSVGEFHYLHHQPDGQPYEDPALMSHQIIRAALESGIAITHLPALYAYGGFGEKPQAEGQERFLNTVPSFVSITEKLKQEYGNIPQVTLGMAHHSLRAVSPEMMREATTAVRGILPDAPVHILVAAHRQEVEDCAAFCGKTPVEFLLEDGSVDDKWAFVHATHIDADEIRALAASGVASVLCPTTEANQGAGIFPLVDYFEAGGVFGIGSGSQMTVSVLEELRWLEYIQRLVHQSRPLLYTEEVASAGATLYERALCGGAKAVGRKTGRIDIGHRADLVVLDPDMPAMTGKIRDHILDTMIFAMADNPVRAVMSGGRWVVRDGRHDKEDQILQDFRRAMERVV